MRHRAGLDQAELAQKAGMDQSAISNYENGKRPLSDHRKRQFARILGCTVADLLDDEDNPFRLSDQERELIEAYRSANEEQRELTRRVAAPVLPFAPKDKDEAA